MYSHNIISDRLVSVNVILYGYSTPREITCFEIIFDDIACETLKTNKDRYAVLVVLRYVINVILVDLLSRFVRQLQQLTTRASIHDLGGPARVIKRSLNLMSSRISTTVPYRSPVSFSLST